MISVVIPTLNAAETLPACLAALLPATVGGLVKQVIIADGGSDDATVRIADEAGADIVTAPRGRGAQLAAGARAARGGWFLFLHADTVLAEGWESAAERFIGRVGLRGDHWRAEEAFEAGYFRFRFDDDAGAARWVERGVALRCRFAQLPYGDQGLLISRGFYDELGGYLEIPLMEDVDLVDRIKRAGQLTMLDAEAVTSAERYRRDGYGRRVLRNLRCLMAWKRGVDPARIAEMYG